MVFVTVGNGRQPFRRLLQAVDLLAQAGELEDVFVQCGHTSDELPSCTQKPFLTPAEFEESIRRADLVITHGGCTQLTIVKMGKIPVVMPRLSRFGEVVNDHQLQLVEELASQGYVIPVYDAADLSRAVSVARKTMPIEYTKAPMIRLVAEAVARLSGTIGP